MWGGIGKVKLWKLTGWHKDWSLGKQKPCMQAKQTRYFVLAGRCSATSRKAGLITHNGFLGRQTPSLWTSSSSSFFTPAFIGEHDAIWCGTSLWPVRSAVLAVSPSSSLCSPTLLAVRTAWEAEESLALCKFCSAMTKTLACYHRYCHPKSKMQHCMSYCEENWLYSSQNHDTLLWEKLLCYHQITSCRTSQEQPLWQVGCTKCTSLHQLTQASPLPAAWMKKKNPTASVALYLQKQTLETEHNIRGPPTISRGFACTNWVDLLKRPEYIRIYQNISERTIWLHRSLFKWLLL